MIKRIQNIKNIQSLSISWLAVKLGNNLVNHVQIYEMYASTKQGQSNSSLANASWVRIVAYFVSSLFNNNNIY